MYVWMDFKKILILLTALFALGYALLAILLEVVKYAKLLWKIKRVIVVV